MNATPDSSTRSRGFTLLEMLVVLIIAGLMVALVPPLFSGAVSGTKVKGSARDLVIALREARSKAIIQNNEQVLHLDLETPRYRVGDGDIRALPDGMAIAVETITGARVDPRAKHTLRFFPDGSSSGELVTLTGGSRVYHLQLNWLTGGITVTEGTIDAG